MTQRSFHWDGASVGDADALTVNAADGIGYRLANEDYESLLVDYGFRMLWNGDENRGVLKGWLNELAVTGVATPVAVDTGGAIVYGMPYENTVSVNVAVPSPTTDTRQDRIVLRRDWSAQTVRITRIAGVEGGGVPAMTQSAAPSGSGIWDIPLATLSITTGGVITVTDAREYCQFGTVPRLDSMGTTQLTNDSVDWADRETRTCKQWLLGGDLLPLNAVSGWNFDSNVFSNTVAAVWGTGASSTQGWRANGVATGGVGVAAHFTLPPNWVPGTGFTSHIWWTCNSAIASTFYVRGDFGMWASNQSNDPYGNFAPYSASYAYASTYISETPVLSDWYRETGPYFPDSAAASFSDFLDLTVSIVLWYNNSAGAEDMNILGIEIDYTGYV